MMLEPTPTNATVVICQPNITTHKCQEIPEWWGFSIGLTLFVQLVILLVFIKSRKPVQPPDHQCKFSVLHTIDETHIASGVKIATIYVNRCNECGRLEKVKISSP